MEKRISFLATGSELLNGDAQDTNCYHFSKIISSKGGICHTHMQVSDEKNDIVGALTYLLSDSDVVIVTGGLGPTSDDTTRYAVAEVTNKKLVFNEETWQYICDRLTKFNLKISESNRQQALFPLGAVLFPNAFGTAYGAYIEWNQKHIFMLPGPPKECVPMFENLVLPMLQNLKFLERIKTHYWLTMGLVEAEIASQLDHIASQFNKSMAYRWHYPFLEIKLTVPIQDDVDLLLEAITQSVWHALVSRDLSLPMDRYHRDIQKLNQSIAVLDRVLPSDIRLSLQNQHLRFIDEQAAMGVKAYLFEFSSTHDLAAMLVSGDFAGRIGFECIAYYGGEVIYQHKISTSCRGKEILRFVEAYFMWQMANFIELNELF